MRHFKVRAYNASLPELWRFSGKKPSAFLVALYLKATRSKRLEFENPDPSARQVIPLGELPSEVTRELKGPMDEIAACGYRLASVRRLESDGALTYGLMFVGPREDRFVPLFASLSKGTVAPLGLVRSSIVSFDTDFDPIVTSSSEPQFDPAPTTVYIYEPGRPMAVLDRIHSREIREHPKPVIQITTSNIEEITARLEESSYDYLRSRGIYSEKYEKEDQK